MRLCLILLAVAALLAGCIAQDGPYTEAEAPAYAMYPERDSSYTHSEAVWLDKKKVGYLVTFDEVPVGSNEPQFYVPGTAFIKDLAFTNLGFMTPKGQTFRFDEKGRAVELTQADRPKALATFFGKPFGACEIKPLVD